MNRIVHTVIIFFVSVAHPYAKPSVSASTKHYTVDGITENEIRNNLNIKKPINESGKSYDGYTEWFVNWNFWWNESNGTCEISKVKTKVNIKIILPKLKNRARTNSLTKKWKRYERALIAHENGHKSHGIKAANEIEKNIMNMKKRKTCKKLETEANRIAEDIVKKYQNIDVEYDRKTKHGMNEGAVFP